ncbi:uncharacterized protein LOC118324853 [Morone saxatilis]|uniref:uncharacterized protein LOC118324853 n=1 Tax=Morone saxatilis TaxID=34816 RepID=UPI0015E1E24D|nr:uncharacterized protein LOC118324853 [Morone saxatilis]
MLSRHSAGVIEVTEEDREEEEEEEEDEKEEGPDTVMRRFSNTLQFSWVLLSALLDSLTAWVRGLCQEHIDISTVLRIERCMLTQQAKQGNVPNREAIHVYYQEQMMKTSRESGLDYSTHEVEVQTSAERRREEGVNPDTDEEKAGGQTAEVKPDTEPGGDYPDKPEPEPISGDPFEPGPELVSAADGPDKTEPVSGGSGETVSVKPETAEGDPVFFVAKTSQKWRPKLSRMKRVQSLSSSSSSEEERISPTYRLVPSLQKECRASKSI